MITAPIPQSFRFRPIDSEMPNFDNTFDADATVRPRMIIPWRQYVPTDVIKVQMVASTGPGRVTPRLYSVKNGLAETEIVDVAILTIGAWEYTTFTIDLTAYDQTAFYQLKVYAEPIVGPLVAVYMSEPFWVMDQPTFLKLQWYNSENAYLMDYSSDTFIHELWIDGELESSPFAGDMSIYSNQGSIVKLKEVSNRVFKITVEVPAYIAEIITLATAHDRFYVNEIQYTVDKKPDINRIGQSNLYKVEMEIVQSIATGINKHDAG